jgi:hypothetical protein
VGGASEKSVPSSQFCCEPETALKNNNPSVGGEINLLVGASLKSGTAGHGGARL